MSDRDIKIKLGQSASKLVTGFGLLLYVCALQKTL